MSKSNRFIPEKIKGSVQLTKGELKILTSLSKKKGRQKEGRFLAEGVRLLESALNFGVYPSKIFYYPPGLTPRGKDLVREFSSERKIETQTVSSRDFHRICDTENPQGIIGLFQIPALEFKKSSLAKAKTFLIVDNIQDPGNLGTIIRGAVAFEFDPILVFGDTVEAYSPKVIRSTAGAIFAAKLMKLESADLAQLKENGGIRLIVSALDGVPEDKWKLNFGKSSSGTLAFVVGSESEGVSSKLRELADQIIRVSHSEKQESLNAGVAASVIMRHIYLQGRWKQDKLV
ncbi:MAG: RNA methyltransferase [candidate division Zixibacteria bacterium]|nr:RNA methyltransferase [candidate division Zixibacteria bacterium]